jgi:hypothetical protein
MDIRGTIMKKINIINLQRIMCIALLTFSLPSLAEVTLQGFASFVGGATLDSDETYNGYEDKIEYDKNSVYGLQAVSDLGDGLTATGQIVARGSENYKPEFEWMYMTYNITPTLSAKVGRIRTPFYMLSEYLEVGYTYHWIRPPEELYAAQITNMDGASLLYNVPMGSIDAQFAFSVGNRRNYSEDPTFDESDFTKIVAATGQFEMGSHVAKLIYVQGGLTINTPAVTGVEAVMQSDPAFLVNNVLIDERKLTFTGGGVDLNFDPIRVILEYSLLDFGGSLFLPEETRTLAAVIYSFGETAVSYSLSGNKKESDPSLAASATGLTNIRTGVGVDGIADTADDVFLTNQQYAAGTLASTDREVTTHTIGLRHDFHDSAAVKVELISTEESKLDTEATLVRFGVDMLF